MKQEIKKGSCLIMTDKLVVGFIGNGKSANRYHIPFILTRKDKIEIKKNLYNRPKER